MPGITFLTLSFAAIIVFGTAVAWLYDSLEARIPALRTTPYGASGRAGARATRTSGRVGGAVATTAPGPVRGGSVSRGSRGGENGGRYVESRRRERRVDPWGGHGFRREEDGGFRIRVRKADRRTKRSWSADGRACSEVGA